MVTEVQEPSAIKKNIDRFNLYAESLNENDDESNALSDVPVVVEVPSRILALMFASSFIGLAL